MTDLISSAGPLATTEPVVIEVLAGARTDEHEVQLRRLLVRFDYLHVDIAADFEAAAHIYRRCGKAGTTPRGMLDCMIAAVAWRRGATLLSHDVDLDRVAQVIGIELDEASLRGC